MLLYLCFYGAKLDYMYKFYVIKETRYGNVALVYFAKRRFHKTKSYHVCFHHDPAAPGFVRMLSIVHMYVPAHAPLASCLSSQSLESRLLFSRLIMLRLRHACFRTSSLRPHRKAMLRRIFIFHLMILDVPGKKQMDKET